MSERFTVVKKANQTASESQSNTPRFTVVKKATDNQQQAATDFLFSQLPTGNVNKDIKNHQELIKSKTTIPSVDYDEGYATEVKLKKELDAAEKSYKQAQETFNINPVMKGLSSLGLADHKNVQPYKDAYESKKKEYETYKNVRYYSSLPNGEIKTTNTQKKKYNSFGSGDVDWKYEYINDINNTRANVYTAKAGSSPYTKYEYMTDREKGIYNYLYSSKGKEEAEKFLDFIDNDLEERVSAKILKKAQEQSKEHPYISAAVSIPANILAAGEQIGNMAESVLTGETKRNMFADVSSVLRSALPEKVDWEINNWDAFDFLYNTGMSAADSLVVAPLGPVGAVGLGLSAAASATNDIIDRGGTNAQAFWGGIAAGVFEGFFEKFSLSQLESMQEGMVKGFKDYAKNVGKSMLTNASEETATEVANVLYDYAANGGISQFAMLVEEYMQDSNIDEATAKKNAAQKLGLQILEAGASGALMGFGFGSLGSAAAYNNYRKNGLQDVINRLASDEDVSVEEINKLPQLKKVAKTVAEREETYTINTPERLKLRNDITNKLLQNGSATIDSNGKVQYNGDVKQERRADIVIGLSAAGKSSVLVNPLSEEYSSRVIDSDMAKEEIPEFDNGLGANAVHRESQDIIYDVLAEATKNGDNIVLPIVGGNNVQSLINRISDLRGLGYSVHLHLNELSNNKALGRSLNRYLETGRYIPPEVIKAYGDTPTQNFNAIINTEGLVDGYSHYSNDVERGQNPKLIQISENDREFGERLLRREQISQRMPSEETGTNSSNTTESVEKQATSEDGAASFLPEDIKTIALTNPNKKRHHTTRAEQDYIKKICNALGRTVVFEDVVKILKEQGIDLNGQIPDGYIDKNNVIHINFTVIDPVTFILKHELTHFGEGTEAYKRFVEIVRGSKAFKEWLIDKTKLDPKKNSLEVMIATAREDVMNCRSGETEVDVTGAMAEVIADFVGDCLFKDNGSGLNAMLSDLDVKERHEVIQYILDFLSYLKKKLAGDKDIVFEISRLEDSFNRMLSEANQNESNNNREKNQYSFARVKDSELIGRAEAMEKEGKSKTKIWHELGIIRDFGDEWVFEIDDSEMEVYPDGDIFVKDLPEYKEYLRLLNKKKMTDSEALKFARLDEKLLTEYDFGRGFLKNYVKHDKLFEIYPQLKELIFEFQDLSSEVYGGYYSKASNKIVLSSAYLEGDVRELKKALVHEIQHVIQTIDNREPGSSIEYWNIRLERDKKLPVDPITGEEYTPFDAYWFTKGELEAREASERVEYTEDERREDRPFWFGESSVSARETIEAKNEEYMSAVESGNTKVAQNIIDEVAKANGYTERLYHQTGADFTEFNTDNQMAGKYDWELPTGTFLKPTNEDIGLKGKKQMELYAKLQKPLTFKNRQDAQSFWKKNVDGYADASKAVAAVDREYSTKYDQADEAVRQYMLKWRHENPTAQRKEINSDTEFQSLLEKQQEILDDWESTSNDVSLKAKNLIDNFIDQNDYDGIIVEKDQDGENRSTKSYIVFNSNQLKDASAVTYDYNGEVIPLSERFDNNKKDIRFSVPKNARKITENMSELERYEILKNRKLSVAEEKATVYDGVIDNHPDILDKKLKKSTALGLLKKIGEEFGVFRSYENNDIEVSFEFGKNNLSESIAKQKGNYDAYAQMLSCFSDVISNAIGIEVHNRNSEGYKTDRTLKQMYVLCSAFIDGDTIIPVKLEVKEFTDKPNRLYVAVALEGIKRDRVVSMGVPNNRSHVRTSPVTISIRDLFSKINPKDRDFIKYIPDGFLTEEQIKVKKDTAKNGISKYSISKDNDNVNENFAAPPEARALLDKYESGEISREEYIEQLDGLWNESHAQFGSIGQGENAKLPLAIPKQVEKTKFTEKFIRTIVETGRLTPEMIEDVEHAILLGDTYSYKPLSNKKAQEYADAYIEKGIAEETWKDAVNSKKIGKNEIAIGEKLLLQAIEGNNRLGVLELSAELSDALTRAGQTVQAARMLKQMTGVGRLVAAQRNVKTLNKDLTEKYGKDAPLIQINLELAKQLAAAKTQEEIDMVDEEIKRDIANQVPVTFLDKWNAWRYFAMLSNPKTHIRNLVGNTIFIPAVRVKDALATGMESAFIKDKSKRTKSLIIQKEYAEFAKNDGKKAEVKELLKGNKYNDKTALKEKQRIFKTQALEFLTRFNSNALEAEDMLFKNKHYIHALGGFLQARKVDLKNVSEDVLTEARIYAVNEARKATFNDESALANWVQNFGNKNLATNIAVEGVLPFKRTPINIVKRGIEYSPIGLAKTLVQGVYDVKKGKFIPTEFIDGLASGLTGTGIMLAGMFLANLGLISGGEDDDDESTFEKMLGKQEYAIEFAGKSYTIDFAAPACIPFFIGAEIVNTINEGEDFQLSQIGNAVWNSLEPITNLSMLSGIQGVIESARYAEPSQTLAAIAGDAITSYAMQSIPSIAGAIGRTIDPTQRAWYTDKNSKVFDSFSQSVINNVKSKVPGLSYTQIPKIDAWGRIVSRGKVGERILENFVSPGYYSELDYTETSDELKRLFVKTGESVFPKVAEKSIDGDGKTKQLTPEEYVKYAKAKGEYSFDYIKEFMDSSAYKSLTDAERADVITNLYEFANAKAKSEVSDYDLLGKNSKFKTVTRRERDGISAVDYYIYRAIRK